MDSWKEWRVMCLSILSVEDVEDVYIIGIMITGFLLFGVSSLPVIIEGMCRAVNTQVICELNRKHAGLLHKMDANLEKLSARLGCNGPSN